MFSNSEMLAVLSEVPDSGKLWMIRFAFLLSRSTYSSTAVMAENCTGEENCGDETFSAAGW